MQIPFFHLNNTELCTDEGYLLILDRVWLPIPITFCAIAAGLVVATLVQQLTPSLIAIGCVGAGIPVCSLTEALNHATRVPHAALGSQFCMQFYFLEPPVHRFLGRLLQRGKQDSQQDDSIQGEARPLLGPG